MKTEDLEYVNDTNSRRNKAVHSGRRLKVTVLRVAVVLAGALIIAYVFSGVALFLSIMEKNKMPQSTTTSPITITKPVATQTLAKLHCDDDWHFSGEKCYNFSKFKTSWDSSRTICLELGTDLVKVETRQEQKFLFDKMKTLMPNAEEMFWIGLTDSETEGEWKWTDGSSLNKSVAFWFVSGTANEPDNWTIEKYPAGEDCGRMGTRTGAFEFLCWFDVPCSIKSRFICEKEPRTSLDP